MSVGRRPVGRAVAWLGLLLTIGLGGPAVPAQGVGADSGGSLDRALLSTAHLLTLKDGTDQGASCTGVVVGDDRTLLTNWHCVGKDAGVQSKSRALNNARGWVFVAPTRDPRQAPSFAYVARVVVGEPTLDVAVIRIFGTFTGDPERPGPLPDGPLPLLPLPLANSDSVRLGQGVRVLGYPSLGGDTITLTEGHISGFDDETGDGVPDAFKTDAEVNHGNSGGLAINDQGQHIGIPTWARTDEKGSGKISRIRMINAAVPYVQQALALPAPTLADAQTPAQPPGLGTSAAPSTPVAPRPAGTGQVGPVTFRADASGPVPPAGTPLPSGLKQVVAQAPFQGMTSGADWGSVWTYQGQTAAGATRGTAWTLGRDGTLQDTLSAAEGQTLPDGRYGWAMYLGGQLAAQGGFEIGASTPAVAAPAAPPAPGAQDVVVRGTVQDADSNRPIPEAVVVFLKPGVELRDWAAGGYLPAQVAAQATTDASGTYQTTPPLPRGQTYHAVFAAKDYRITDGPVEVTADDPTPLALEAVALQHTP